jgi:hypothetical protein
LVIGAEGDALGQAVRRRQLFRQFDHRRSRLGKKRAQFLAREMHVVEMIAVAMHVDGASIIMAR